MQYNGPLVPCAQATIPEGGRVQPTDISPAPPLKPYCDSLGNLNPMQSRAACLLRDNLLSMIEGPPGTGKTGTLASAALAWFAVTKQPVLICTYSHTAAETALARLAQLAPQYGVVERQLAYLRDFKAGPPELHRFHAFTRAGLDDSFSRKTSQAKLPFLNQVLDDVEAGHTAVVVCTAYWSDYLRRRR